MLIRRLETCREELCLLALLTRAHCLPSENVDITVVHCLPSENVDITVVHCLPSENVDITVAHCLPSENVDIVANNSVCTLNASNLLHLLRLCL